MDPKERLGDPEEAFRSAVEGILSGLWTALPCIVETVNYTAMTVTLQPAVMGRQRLPDGTTKDIALPLLLDVPLAFQGGGGFTVTLPVKKGDEAVAVFASRCIDSWWQSGGVQTQAELRMHDLSDAFAFVGVRSIPRVLAGGVSSVSAQIRNDAGTVYVDIAPDTVTAFAPNVKVHAGTSYSWDVNGYGQKITWTGGVNYTIDNYTTGAVVTTNNHAISPPESP